MRSEVCPLNEDDSLIDIGRVVKQFGAVGAISLTFFAGVTSAAQSQQNSVTAPPPTPSQSATERPQESTGTGSISSTVFDESRDVLQGAQVTLTDSLGAVKRTVDSDSNGHFVFTTLYPGFYTLKVTGNGMSTYTSPPISLIAGQVLIFPPVTLAVSGVVTSVTVSGNKEELAAEQVRIAVQQRIGGVIPNFYSSYDWNAPPMQTKQKFQLGVRTIIDPVSFLVVAGIAGMEQHQNVFPGYGGGIEGYGKRYGAAYANHVSATLLGKAVYPSIFRQDPRYFYKGKGTVRSRALYAMSAAVIAKGDDGRWKPNYSNVLGNFSAAAISNLYYPSSDQGVSLIMVNGLVNTGADAASNLLREFVLKKITTHVPAGNSGQP
jgi:hypothetical protein